MEETWAIERLAPGGEGFGRLADGRAAFAPGALPGDRIRAGRLEERRGFVRALTWSLVAPSPDRVEPACPIADRCGGCPLMSLARPAQLGAKLSILREALARTGGIASPPVDEELVALGTDLAYRERARLHVSESGTLGYCARRSHEVIAITKCAICSDAINTAITWLAAPARRSKLKAFDTLEVRSVPGQARAHIDFVPRGPSLPSSATSLLTAATRRFHISVRGTPPPPETQLAYPLPRGGVLHAPAGVFTQVNWLVNCEIIERVCEGAKARCLETFADLYCGVGNFTLPLLQSGLSGMGAERSEAAVVAARRSALAAGLTARFFTGDASTLARQWAEAGERFDLVLLDPPRRGAPDVLQAVSSLARSHVALLSCEPVTFARDAKALLGFGFELERVTAFDMFPQTPHLESLGWFRRR